MGGEGETEELFSLQMYLPASSDGPRALCFIGQYTGPGYCLSLSA